MILAFLWEGLLQEQEGSDWWGVMSHRLRLRILWQSVGRSGGWTDSTTPGPLAHPPAIIRCNAHSCYSSGWGSGVPNRHSAPD